MTMWTALLVPRLDLLGPGSRLRVAAREGRFPNALANYRKEPEKWADVAELRLRDKASQDEGAYWLTVWADPMFREQLKDVEYMIAGCQHEFESLHVPTHAESDKPVDGDNQMTLFEVTP